MINAKGARWRVRRSRHHAPVIVSLMLTILAVLTAGGSAFLPTAASAETTAASPADVSLRIATFNAQFLPPVAAAHGCCEDKPDRARTIAERIAASGADVVALQEIFDEGVRAELVSRLRGTYPHYCRR